MFDISWSEFLVIGVVALILIGPKELPGVLRTLGQWMGKVRRMASEFQGQFNEAMREAEMEDLKKHIDSMTEGLDPIEQVRKEVESAVEDKPTTDAAASDAGSAAPTVPAPEAPVATAVEASVAPSAPEPGAPTAADVKPAGDRAA